jgi:hypothetical protein
MDLVLLVENLERLLKLEYEVEVYPLTVLFEVGRDPYLLGHCE